MNTIQEQPTSNVALDMDYIGRRLPFEFEQGWTFSRFYMNRFLAEHPPESLKIDSKFDNEVEVKLSDDQRVIAVALQAAGRMDWLLEQRRPALSGVFSEQDIAFLLDCYQGNIFSPDRFNRIASDLCDHLGIELEEYQTSSVASLVDKLIGLDSVQLLILADTLEQAWHRGMKQEGLSPKEFFATLGIELV